MLTGLRVIAGTGTIMNAQTGLCLSSDTRNQCALGFSASCLNSSSAAACTSCTAAIAIHNSSHCKPGAAAILNKVCVYAPFKPAIGHCLE